MTVEAGTKEEAIKKMQEMMTQAALDDHMATFHKPDEQKPTLQMSHMMISQNIQEIA